MKPAPVQQNPPADTRKRLLEAAFHVFARHGYDGTTIRMVCEAAGVSVGVIHYHWGSKELLWQSVCERCSQRTFDIMMTSLDYDLPPRAGVPHFFEGLFDALAAEPELMRIVMWATLEADTLDYGKFRLQFQPLIEFGTTYLGAWQERGITPELDIEVLLMSIRAMVIFSFADRSGHKHAFGKDLDDPAHAKRVKDSLVQSCMAMFGLEQTGPQTT